MKPRAIVAISMITAGALSALSATSPAGDSDTYWHLATARETLAHGFVRTDAFSWSARGAPVGTDQWLGQLIIYAGYLAAGWQGIIAVRAVIVAVLVFAVVAAALARRSGSPIAAVAIAVPALLLSRFLWTDRPELLGAACFALLVLLLQLPGGAPLVATAPLLVLWANVHGSFALGSIFVIAIAAHALWRGGRPRWPLAAAIAGAVVSFVLTPAGIGTIASPGLHLLHPPREIQEWAIPDPTTTAGLVWALVLGAVLASAALTPRARDRDLVLIVPLAALSLVAIRYAPLFAIAATPYLAERIPLAVGRTVAPLTGPSRTGGPRSMRPAPSIADALLIVAGLALVLGGIAAAPRDVDEQGFPADALRSLPSGPGLLNEYDWGGWLIWRERATPVFVDGRLVPYLGAVMEDYRTILEARPGWRDVVARRGVRSILVRPRDPVAVRALDLGWPVVFRSASTVLISVPTGR